MVVVAVSGGFDPIHAGHLAMFEEAKKLGDYLVVILNSDAWLMRKKGYVFMPAIERAAIIGALKPVDEVYIFDSQEDDVCQALNKLDVDIFANGGDRKNDNTPEVEYCEHKGIRMAFNVGGGKVESSSELVNKAMSRVMVEERPWGSFSLLQKHKTWWAKVVDIKAGGKLSLQRHAKRDEIWVCVEGAAQAISGKGDVHEVKVGGAPIAVRSGTWHRLMSEHGAKIIEIALGEPVETDIERREDEYGRA